MTAAFQAVMKADGVSLSATGLIALRSVALHTAADRVLAALPGGFATRRKGQGQEVADLREYQSGDDIRHLDRSATARTGRLHVRQFQEERDRVTLLVADFRPPMLWGISRVFLSVAAAEVLTLIGWRMVRDGGRVGLLALTPDGPVAVLPRGRVRGMLDVIGGLVRAHDTALRTAMAGEVETGPLDRAMFPVDRLCPVGSEVIIASGFDREGDGLADRLDQIDRRRTVRLIALTDADALRAGQYPVRLHNGQRVQLRLGALHVEQTMAATNRPPKIAGRPVLQISAAAAPGELARHIVAASPWARGKH